MPFIRTPHSAFSPLWCATHSHSVDPEKQHRADDREDDAPHREALEPAIGDQIAEEPAEERADDANEDRHDEATGIVARHESFRDRACNETKHDPCDYTHASLRG